MPVVTSLPECKPGLEQVLSEEPFGLVVVPGEYPDPWVPGATHAAQRCRRHVLQGANGSVRAGYCRHSLLPNPEQQCRACAAQKARDKRVQTEERWLLTVIDRRPWRVAASPVPVLLPPDPRGVVRVGTRRVPVMERRPYTEGKEEGVPWMRVYVSLPWAGLQAALGASDGTCACGSTWLEGCLKGCESPEPASVWNRPVRIVRRGAGPYLRWEATLAPARNAPDAGRIRLKGTESGYSADRNGFLDPTLAAVPPLDFSPMWEVYGLASTEIDTALGGARFS